MKRFLFPILVLAAAVTLHGQPSRYVDPFIGTAGMGHTFPGACVPFGGIQLSPDTDTIPHNVAGRYQARVYDHCAGYRHDDPTIVGFSHRHLSGTGHSDLGDILLMPFTGQVRLNPGTADAPEKGYRSRYSHENEVASPGYYAVDLTDDGIRAELTATPRVGVHRYTYPAGARQQLVLDLGHGIYKAGPGPTIRISRFHFPSRSPIMAQRTGGRGRTTVSGAGLIRPGASRTWPDRTWRPGWLSREKGRWW